MGKEKDKRYIDETSMTEFTKNEVKKRKIIVRAPPKAHKKEVYRKGKVVYKGYNCLENYGIVRKYIQRYYDIDFSIIETLLYLYPKGYFTLMDYYHLEKQFHIASVRRLVVLGYAKMAARGNNKGDKALYTLTYKSKNIVENFYETLFGDRPFDVSKADKLFDATRLSDGKTLRMIKKLDQSFIKNKQGSN